MLLGSRNTFGLFLLSVFLLGCQPDIDHPLEFENVYARYISGELVQEKVIEAYQESYPLDSTLDENTAKQTLAHLQADLYQYGFNLYESGQLGALNALYDYFLDVEDYRINMGFDWTSEESIGRYLASVAYFSQLFTESSSASEYYSAATQAASTYQGKVSSSVLTQFESSIEHLAALQAERYLSARGMSVSLRSGVQNGSTVDADISVTNDSVGTCESSCNRTIMPRGGNIACNDGETLVDGVCLTKKQICEKNGNTWHSGSCYTPAAYCTDVQDNTWHNGSCYTESEYCEQVENKKWYKGSCISKLKYAFELAKDSIIDFGDGLTDGIGNLLGLTEDPGSTTANNNLNSNMAGYTGDYNNYAFQEFLDTDTSCPGTTPNPVDTRSGCKFWTATDADLLAEGLIGVSRNYKQFHRNDFTLGKYWSFALDTRIILGTDNIERIEAEKQTIQGYADGQQAIIDSVDDAIDDIKAEFDMSNSHISNFVNSEYIAPWTTDIRNPATTKKADYLVLLTPLNDRVAKTNARIAKNQYAMMGADSGVALVGNHRVKWISPAGAQMSFLDEAGIYTGEHHDYALKQNGTGYIVTAPNGTQYSYNAWGLLTKVTDPSLNTVTINRNPNNALRIDSIVDQNNRSLRFHYDTGSDNRVDRIVDDAGRELNYVYKTYGGEKLLHKVIDFDGLTTTFEYEHYSHTYDATRFGQLESITESVWLMSSRQHGEGTRSMTYEWSNVKQQFVITTQIDETEHSWSYAYPSDTQTIVTDRTEQLQTHYLYEAGTGLLSEQSYVPLAEGAVETKSFDYDPTRNLTLITDEYDKTIASVYLNGKLQSRTKGNLGTESFTYQGDQVDLYTNGAQDVTDSDYDPTTGLIISTTLPSDSDVDGNLVQYAYYDGTNKLKSKTQSTSEGDYKTEWGYDLYGYVNSIKEYGPSSDQPQLTTLIVNDEIGRKLEVTQKVSATESRVTKYSYCKAHRDQPIVDIYAECPVTSRSYDVPVRIELPDVDTGIKDELGNSIVDQFSITFEYNNFNQLVKKTDYTGVVTEFTYYKTGEIDTKKETVPHPEGSIERSWKYTYNEEQSLETVLEKQSQADAGRMTKYEYDFRQRLKRMVVLDANNFNDETDIAEEFDYYPNGWLREKRVYTGLIDTPVYTWTYDYHDSGLLKTETAPDGGSKTYWYDGAGRLERIVELIYHADGITSEVTTYIDPTARGWSASVENPDGDKWSTYYDITGAELARTIDNPKDQTNAITWTNTNVNHLGQALKTQIPSGEVIERQFNGVGEQTYEKNAVGYVTTRKFDAMGRQVEQGDANGLKTTWTYQQTDHQLIVTRTQTDTLLDEYKPGRVRIERNFYDFLGRLARTEQDVSASELQDARTLVWDYLYNEDNLLETIVYPELDPDAEACTSVPISNATAQVRLESGCFLTTEYQYSDYGYLESEIMPGGRETLFNELDGLGRPANVATPDTKILEFRYNYRGQTVQMKMPDRLSDQFIQYNSRGQQEAVVDPTGNTQYWVYTNGGRLASHQYYGDGSSQKQALEPTEYTYTALGEIETVTDPLDFVTRYTFDKNGFTAGMYDQVNTFFDVKSDAIGRVIEQKGAEIDGYAPLTKTDYLNNGRTQVITNDLGHQTTIQYNAFGEVLSITDAKNNTINFSYNERGERIAQVDQLDNAEYFALNTRGQVTQIMDKQAQTTAMAFDAAGNLASITQPEVGTTWYQYDAANRLKAVTSAKGSAANDERYQQLFDYNDNGFLKTATNEIGKVTNYDFDPAGQLNHITLPSQQTIDYQFNARGQMIQRSVAGTNVEKWKYFDDGRLQGIENSVYAETYAYTPTGALDLVTNTTLNQTIDYQIDANSRKVGMVTDHQNVIYERDTLGRISKLIEGDEVYEFGFDANNRIVSKTNPNGTRDLKLYNERGETIAVVLQRAQTEQEIYEDGRVYGFDDAFFLGYKRSDNIPASIDVYAFESFLDTVKTQLTDQFPEDGYITEDLLVYQWNDAGNLIAKQYNEKFSFFYEYDLANRLKVAFEPEGLITRYNWDANGNLDNKTVRNLFFDFDYNEANQLVTSTSWRLEHTGNGNSKGNGNGGAHKNNGTQDDWDQHHEDQSHFFEYLWDAKVNLSETALTTIYTYTENGDLQSEATTSIDGTEVQTYTHDVYGRLTGIDTKYGAQVRFDYDSRDRRIRSAQSGWTEWVNQDDHKTSADYEYSSLYDGRQELSQFNTVNNEQALYRQMTYLPNHVAGLYGQLLKQTLPQWQNSEFDVTGWGGELAPTFYFHGDYQNSTVKITGMDANNSYRFGYTPMGQTYGFKHRYSDEQMTRTFSSHSPNRNVVQNLYSGKYAEPLTGLTQMDARWYNPTHGRFIQGDQYNLANLMLPKGAQSELLRYIGRSQNDLLRDPAQQMHFNYVSGNPLTWTDPLGLEQQWTEAEVLDQLSTTITGQLLVDALPEYVTFVGFDRVKGDPYASYDLETNEILLPNDWNSIEIAPIAGHEIFHVIQTEGMDSIGVQQAIDNEIEALNIEWDIWEELGKPQNPLSDEYEALSDIRQEDPQRFNDHWRQHYESNEYHNNRLDSEGNCP